MRNESAVRHKLKQVVFRHTKEEIDRLLAPSCENCQNLQEGTCQILSVRVEENDLSSDCGSFSPWLSKEEIKTSLRTFFNTAPLSKVRVRFPAVATLMWVLSSEDGGDRDLIPDEDPPEPVPEPAPEPVQPRPISLVDFLKVRFPWP